MGTNAAVIKGALRANDPSKLTGAPRESAWGCMADWCLPYTPVEVHLYMYVQEDRLVLAKRLNTILHARLLMVVVRVSVDCTAFLTTKMQDTLPAFHA